jgi:Rps23 Pro-64 3,4-dihydroxylase Tpa1-like proline 4-hydroxylase
MKNVKKLSISEKEIFVFDDFLDSQELAEFNELLAGGAFRRNETDSSETQHIRQWVRHFEIDSLIEVEFFQRIIIKISNCFPSDADQVPYRAYCNNILYGDMLFAHRDNDISMPDITALLYINKKWETDWGGETVFFDENNDAMYAVSPRPGRLVLFKGGLLHRAGAPQRECYESRLTFAIKFGTKK